jgi:hypothetical protein
MVCTRLGVSAINPLVALYDIYGRKRQVLFFYFVPNTIGEYINTILGKIANRCDTKALLIGKHVIFIT